MTMTPSNPKVEAIRRDVQTSYAELNQLINGPLNTQNREQLYQHTEPEAWSIMENLAHVVEFMPYWAQEVQKLVAEPDQNFGRVMSDERRLSAISDHRDDSLEQIRSLLPGSYERLQEVLSTLTDQDLELTGQHVKYGTQTLAWFIDEFITQHLAGHVTQISACLI